VCAIFYNCEHVAVDEVIVLFTGRVIFRHCIPKKEILLYEDVQTL
jgi:hypothetical protein